MLCLVWSLDLHTNCSIEEQHFLMVVMVAKLFENVWLGETNITSYTDQIKNRVYQLKIENPKDKKASFDILNIYSQSKLLKVETFNGSSVECKMEKSQELSLLNSPQLNITGSYSVISNSVESITITSIFDLSDPKHVFNRTMDLKPNSELDYDM